MLRHDRPKARSHGKEVELVEHKEEWIVKRMEEMMAAMSNQFQNSPGGNRSSEESSSRNKSKGIIHKWNLIRLYQN